MRERFKCRGLARLQLDTNGVVRVWIARDVGPLTGLNGRVAEIVAVWIILAGEDAPRFVTAYPKD